MLTLKHVLINGDEAVWEVEDVHFASPTDAKTSDQKVVYTKTSRGEHMSIDGGTVYVMNEAGKTVAHYAMGTFPATVQVITREHV